MAGEIPRGEGEGSEESSLQVVGLAHGGDAREGIHPRLHVPRCRIASYGRAHQKRFMSFPTDGGTRFVRRGDAGYPPCGSRPAGGGAAGGEVCDLNHCRIGVVNSRKFMNPRR